MGYHAMVGANMPQAAGFMVRGGGMAPGMQYGGQGNEMLGAANALEAMKSDMLKTNRNIDKRSTQSGSPAQWMDNLIQFEKATDAAVACFVDNLQDPDNTDKDRLNRIAEEIVKHANDFRNAAETVAGMALFFFS